MGKPKKGGKKKANDDWEDDVLNEIESLNGTEGATKEQPKQTGKASQFTALENEEPVEEERDKKATQPKTNQKKSKKDKKKNLFDALENEEIQGEDVENHESNDKPEDQKLDIIDNDSDNDMSSKKSKKGKKGKKKFDIDDLEDLDSKEPEPEKKEQQSKSEKKSKDTKDDQGIDGDEDDDGPVIKTAAQKRAEKKEREKKKRALEKEKQKQKTKKTTKTDELAQDQAKDEHTDGTEINSETFEVSTEKEESTEPIANKPQEVSLEPQDKATQESTEPAGGEEEEADETEDKKKKKKKKKKKAGEEEEKKLKKPNKALVKQMQQQLEQMRLEEEKRKKEEEEKLRALEEAENRRLQKLQLEKERKEKKKQKEKERIARLKQEGKFLTKAQKEQKAKQQAMLEAMKQQGIEIPALSNEGQEGVRKPVRYGSKKPKNKQQQQQQQQQEQQESEQSKDSELEEMKEEGKEEELDSESATAESAKEDDVEEEVKDAWDLDSEDEKEDDAKEEAKLEKTEEVIEKKLKEESEEEEESEESSSEDSDDEESEEESDSESDENKIDKTESVAERIDKRKTRAELKRSTDNLRSPVICVLGHVDTGKTKILDKIRHTHVQDGEAGGITQQIGATMVPEDAIKIQTSMIKDFQSFNIQIPGLLIIDTPGHESFSNLRSRGSSLCDMAILVVDIMHGLEPQTIESINLLKAKKTPFVVALNKVDRLFEWKRGPDSSIINTIKKQKRNTKQEFEERVQIAINEFAEQGLNACLFYDNKDTRSYVSLIPTSAHTGDGMGDLISQVVKLTQTRLTQKLSYSEYLDGIVLEVKALPGLGTTIDVILVNGKLKEGDTLILPGIEGPIVTQIRALLTPQPMKELRVKNQYITHKELRGAQGVKISAKDLEKALAGVPIMVAEHEDEVEYCKNEVSAIMSAALSAIKLSDRGVYVQASTLGSLEALLEFLKTSKIPYAGVNIGPVHKKDVMKCSIMLEHDVQYAVILAFDVKIEREAQELADSLGVKVFSAEIIYHLFDKFMAYREEQKRKKREEFKHIAVFPCKLRILPQHIYNSRDPIVIGVSVEAGIIKEGTPVCVPSKNFIDVGVVTGIEANHKGITEARKGMEVCLKIENTPGETPKLYGRHFDHEDLLISKISRQSIDAVKDYFREDLQKTDWQLMIELKKLFQIV